MGELITTAWRCAQENAHANMTLLEKLTSSTVLITGATGLIGSQIVRTLLVANDDRGLDINLILPVRNPSKALKLFGERECIHYVEWRLGDPLTGIEKADYVIHGACGTSSKDFLTCPVTTIWSIIDGCRTILENTKVWNSKSAVFLSTMEIYGEINGCVTEEKLGALDPMCVRNSYPEAKRLSECLFASYAAEFDLNTKVIRLAQTFGEGVSKQDSRVFAEFGRSAIEKHDITLLSDGQKRNVYLSVDDAVSAILYVLLKGEPGVPYNAANEETYCSIGEMADMVLSRFGGKGAKVLYGHDPEREKTFRKSSDLFLDCSRLKALGWSSSQSLLEMYDLMIQSWGDE